LPLDVTYHPPFDSGSGVDNLGRMESTTITREMHMSSQNSNAPDLESNPSISGDAALRGESLEGAEQKSSVEHADYEKARNPDTELQLDGEDDSLYNDGLDVGER
jgi:hypothetical protein